MINLAFESERVAIPKAKLIDNEHRRGEGAARVPLVPEVVVHLIEGTFELSRYFLSPPEALRAVRGVVGSAQEPLKNQSLEGHDLFGSHTIFPS